MTRGLSSLTFGVGTLTTGFLHAIAAVERCLSGNEQKKPGVTTGATSLKRSARELGYHVPH
jgi:hypothetical protein